MSTKKLSVWIAEQGIKKKDFAKMLGVYPAQVSAMIRNDCLIIDNGFEYIIAKPIKKMKKITKK